MIAKSLRIGAARLAQLSHRILVRVPTRTACLAGAKMAVPKERVAKTRSVSALALLLLLAALPLLAAPTTLVDDVIRMSKAGVGADAILRFIQGPPHPAPAPAAER